MEIEIEQIANSIKSRREQEIKQNVRQPAIGRSDGIQTSVHHGAWGYVSEKSSRQKVFWIVLNQLWSDSVLPDTDTDASISRDTKLGAILIQNYEGEHQFSIKDKISGIGDDHIVKIFNRAKYVPAYDENVLASDIAINISGDKKTYFYRNLIEVIGKLNALRKEIKKTQESLIKAETEQDKAQEKLITAKAEKKEEQKGLLLSAEQKKKEAEDLRKKLEKEVQKQQAYISNAQKFIRQNAELRWQPILDPEQDAIKRMKIFDGSVLIINGGPGTGKTTSLIQRIKFLTSNTIEEYKPLTKQQKEIVFDQKTSWIFFSPSKLLALFLKNSMAQEGITASDYTVRVWEKQKEEIIRLYGWVEEEKRIFKFYKQKNGQQENSLFSNQNSARKIIKNFNEYYLKRQIKLLQNKTGILSHIPIDINAIANINNLLQRHFEFEWGKYRKEIDERIKNSTDVKEKERLRANKEEGDQGIFNKSVAFFLNAMPIAYKEFRKEQLSNKDVNWNLELLQDVIDDKNQSIYPDEQAFLIFFINTICYNLYHRYSTYFQEIKHLYISAYTKYYKPVIAIDEATDFSVIDLLAMHSLRHPELSSVTLSGDLMQRMTNTGLESWEAFSDMVDSSQIENLTVSYRQSPTLLSLAQNIYQYSTKRKAEYTSYMSPDPLEPKPLMKISENKNDKLNWIAERIREIDNIYRRSAGSLPSVAVFVPKEEDINDFVSELEEILGGDIPVQGCLKGMVLGESSDVRVYAVDKIKGLEFEAVFFYDLDQLVILDDNLLLKYLYVGLSRATFYLGVTLSKRLNAKLHFIEESFAQNENWRLN